MTELTLASVPCPSCGGAVFSEMRFCPECGGRQANPENETRMVVLKEFATGALENAEQAARDVLRNDMVKKVAGGAMLGLGAATVIPFLTFAAGATLGAVFVGYKALTKD